MSARDAGTAGALVPDKPELDGPTATCPVIGVGASAGGLEAFQAFVRNCKAGMGLAYVFVQHLDPTHDSLLPELLSRRTDLAVRAIDDGMGVEPDVIYLLPPNKELSIHDGVLRLRPFSDPRGQRRPIDTFFAALAADQNLNAACVVLSGTGGDGSQGLRAVKEAGGLTIVQYPSEAKYDGMPNSAMGTGLVDLVLSAAEMPATLATYFRSSEETGQSPEELEADFITRVCEAVRSRTGHDFGHYKTSTVARRIARRMQVVGVDDQATYVRRLLTDAREGHLLFRDLLINVTSFFRDAEAFDVLRRTVLPEILAGKGQGDAVRVWVPGCSSGEEAYSIAMLLAEEADRIEAQPQIHVFATDIDPTMLAIAREATYPPSALASVPPDLLDRYFNARDAGFRLNARIRDIVRVSEHSIVKDPPFSKLDLISCRNLLIYFDNDLQSRVVPIFHYALRPGGFLFLGPSENIGENSDLMTPVDPKHRIFRRSDRPALPLVQPLDMRARPLRPSADPLQPSAGGPSVDDDLIRRRVIDRHAPPFVVVDRSGEVVFASPRTGRYLEFSGGRPSTKLLDLAKRGLRSAIRAVLTKVEDLRHPVVNRDVPLEDDGRTTTLDVICEPLGQDRLLIVFQEARGPLPEGEEAVGVEQTAFTDEMRIRELEDELGEARQALRSTVEELETSNEELKSSNEEMMSMNEELQSANEELSTINDELKSKIDALADAKDDLQNFLDSTQIATVFLDGDLAIRRFTPMAAHHLRLSEVDLGRRIDELRTPLDSETLTSLAAEVLRTLETRETNIGAEDGTEFLLRVLPYRTHADEIRGTVLVLTDITDLVRMTEQLEETRAEAEDRAREIERLYQTSPIAMGVLDRDGRYLRVNEPLAAINGRSIEDTLGRPITEVVPEIADHLLPPLRQVFETGEPLVDHEIRGQTPGDPGADRVWLTDWYPYEKDGALTGVGVNVQDVTEAKLRELQVENLMYELQHRVKNILANVMALVRQAGRSTQNPAIALERLTARLQSLAQTNNLLAISDWRAADLADLVRTELVDVYGAERCDVRGPAVHLNARATLAFAMALHEMATNASKYGALSMDAGTVTVAWSLEDVGGGTEVVLRWSERGGPKVVAPEREGFGSSLIRASFENTLSGNLTRTFAEKGVDYEIRVPYAQAKAHEGSTVGDGENPDR